MTTFDRPVLVLTDHVGDDTNGYTLTEASRQLLTLARRLTSAEVDAVALNTAPDMAALGLQGVTTVFVPDLAGQSPRLSGVVSDALLACIAHIQPAVVLAVSNYRGKEVCARVAATLDSGAAVDVTDAAVSPDGGLLITRSALAGSWTTHVSITRGTPIIALRPSAVEEAVAAVPTTPSRHDLAVTYSTQAQSVTVISSAEQNTNGRVSLTQARTVVVGGRGTDGDFSVVESLADALGGAVGATRVASDEGWVPRSIQIGQTGLSVSPKLYIGLGVSGAIHHTVGMQSSEYIVAICDDPDAPIFEIADFGVVGDIFDIVPQTIAALNEMRGD
ncbi:electron transfer flavoprotein subunit alpha/FixB family protein [Schaalia suimastitidis]|uniref:electron transfer flavoprotein subunit alpha/FixB family protein n=1 Tax=Schaalia suimastitidis TaxID=121163 RepID=UPI000402A7D6|nr:electron transfer flavoprotein subunit alpha/FixB family protein [Schaalia suimastitidis]